MYELAGGRGIRIAEGQIEALLWIKMMVDEYTMSLGTRSSLDKPWVAQATDLIVI